jgi:hypothetical protein
MDNTRRHPAHPTDGLIDVADGAQGSASAPPDSGSLGNGTDSSDAVGRGALAAGGVSGLIYLVAGWITFPDGPTMGTASADEIRAHISASGGTIQAAAAAGVVALAAALVFVPALVRQVRDRLPGSLLADVVLLSGLLVLAYQSLVMTAEGLLRFLPNLLDGVDLAASNDATVQSWYSLGGFTHFLGDLAMVPMIVLIAAFSLAARRGRLLPRWLVWVGLVIVAAGALGMVGIVGEVAALYPCWIAAAFGYFLWILAASVTFLNRLRKRSQHVVTG